MKMKNKYDWPDLQNSHELDDSQNLNDSHDLHNLHDLHDLHDSHVQTHGRASLHSRQFKKKNHYCYSSAKQNNEKFNEK